LGDYNDLVYLAQFEYDTTPHHYTLEIVPLPHNIIVSLSIIL